MLWEAVDGGDTVDPSSRSSKANLMLLPSKDYQLESSVPP